MNTELEEASPSRGKVTAAFGDIIISSNFDSGNLDKAEECKSTLGPGTREFNVWTAPDCSGQPFESGCKSWFYFSVCVPVNSVGVTLRFNVQNLNKQCRLYQQGLTPITKTVPGRGGWDRLRDRVEYEVNNEGVYVLSFQITIPDSRKQTVYFAFCFPHSYTDCQKMLSKLDDQYSTLQGQTINDNSVYYHRELVCRSLEGKRIDLITVSSHRGVTAEREPRLDKLFPEPTTERAHIFNGKKVIFVSSRVHPGESPSSHVFNGFLHFILRRDDPRSVALRDHFVFKLIPMLNPDGVSHGHYRMDTQGINLNRVYLDPDFELYPSIFAARSLIIHYHKRGHKSSSSDSSSSNILPKIHTPEAQHTTGVHVDPSHCLKSHSASCMTSVPAPDARVNTSLSSPCSEQNSSSSSCQDAIAVTKQSGIAFYVDLHAHATKRGCFFYGNYFSDVNEQAENMLFPKLVSLNSPHLDFEQCVFSEKNMYTADKRDGMSKEGSGRVAMYKATGIIHSYTLECNYNSGRQVNALGAATLADGRVTPPHPGSPMAHRYSIHDYEQVGHALAIAALDFYQLNPWTRLPNTEYKCLAGLRDSLIQRLHNTRAKREKLGSARQRGKWLPPATPTVEEEPPLSGAVATKTSTQASKLVILKNQQTLGLSKGSASIAYDIAFVTEGKRAKRRANPPKSGRRAKQRGGETLGKQTPTELSIPSAVKPSVQDVVFPLHTLKADMDASKQPVFGVSEGQLPLETTANSRMGPFPTVSSLRIRPYMHKDLRRAKTEPLPAINVMKHKLTPAEGSKMHSKPCDTTMKRGARPATQALSNDTKLSTKRRHENGLLDTAPVGSGKDQLSTQ